MKSICLVNDSEATKSSEVILDWRKFNYGSRNVITITPIYYREYEDVISIPFQSVEKNAFADFPNLEFLGLNETEINQLGANSFQDLKKLKK